MRNKEEVTASHLELNADGVNNAGKVPESYFYAVKNFFHRIFCFKRSVLSLVRSY